MERSSCQQLDRSPEFLMSWYWLRKSDGAMAGNMLTCGWAGKDLVVEGAKDIEESRMVLILSSESC